MSNREAKRILIIDKQSYWRTLSSDTLKAAGFSVQVLDNYDQFPEQTAMEERPDLIVLGCANIRHDERVLIARILESGQHLLVLCTSLPWNVMRSLFLAGADDVTNKPYDPDRLNKIVGHAFEAIAPRGSYQETRRKRVI